MAVVGDENCKKTPFHYAEPNNTRRTKRTWKPDDDAEEQITSVCKKARQNYDAVSDDKYLCQ